MLINGSGFNSGPSLLYICAFYVVKSVVEIIEKPRIQTFLNNVEVYDELLRRNKENLSKCSQFKASDGQKQELQLLMSTQMEHKKRCLTGLRVLKTKK